jgi:hypothetical protein
MLMPITLTPGAQIRHVGTYDDIQSLTQSTATAEQAISLTSQITTIDGGTGTGFSRGRFGLASGAAEGFRKTILMLSTGEAYVRVTNTATGEQAGVVTYVSATALSNETPTVASATGVLVLNQKGDFMDLLHADSTWFVMVSRATVATAT